MQLPQIHRPPLIDSRDAQVSALVRHNSAIREHRTQSRLQDSIDRQLRDGLDPIDAAPTGPDAVARHLIATHRPKGWNLHHARQAENLTQMNAPRIRRDRWRTGLELAARVLTVICAILLLAMIFGCAIDQARGDAALAPTLMKF